MKCPYCAEDIKDKAVVCRHCGNDIQAIGGTVRDAHYRPIRLKGYLFAGVMFIIYATGFIVAVVFLWDSVKIVFSLLLIVAAAVSAIRGITFFSKYSQGGKP